MTTAWTLPVQDILTDALQLIGVVGSGQVVAAEDHDVAMKALDGILKELPLHGVSWPKITASPASLAWDGGTPAQIALPADYFGVPFCYYVAASGARVALDVLTKARYDELANITATAEYPTSIYIAPNKTAFIHPVPTANPALKLTYQAVTSDAVLSSSPDVAQTWIAGLGLWVANEIAPKFGVDMQIRADIAQRFLARRSLMLAYATETAPICFTVAD
jgi:hypothetical protein